MEPNQNRRLDLAIRTAMQMVAGSPVYTSILSGWHDQPTPGLTEITDRYCRILSTSTPDLTLALSGLHHAALSGNAPRLARFCASCGGHFGPESDHQMTGAANADLQDNLDEVLDFMLGQEPRHEPIEAVPLLLLGSLVTVKNFGGAISLVEIGCGGGSRLLFDQYHYQFGPWALEGRAKSSTRTGVQFTVEIDGPSESIGHLLNMGMPEVTARSGLSADLVDLTDRDQLRLYEAFVAPDHLDQITRLRSAAGEVSRHGRLQIQRGDPAVDLLSLLSQAYRDMPPGNTLLLTDLLQWNNLHPEDRQRVAHQVQSFVARLQPHKPVAWLQVARLNPSLPKVDARLHLFGWADPEDRSVRHLAQASPDLRRLQWIN